MTSAVTRTKLRVDWSDLEIAFRDGSTGIESFFDLLRGEVVMLFDDAPDERDSVLRHPERFVIVPHLSRQGAQEILQAFVETLPPSPQRRRLGQALDSAAPFKTSTEQLRAIPSLQRRYEQFEERAVFARILKWLKKIGVQVQNPPPGRAQSQAA